MGAADDDAPHKKVCVRAHVPPPHYEVPEGNMCANYIEACERLGVTANTAVAKELLRMVRLLAKAKRKGCQKTAVGQRNGTRARP